MNRDRKTQDQPSSRPSEPGTEATPVQPQPQPEAQPAVPAYRSPLQAPTKR
jgi:hypothetical protein